MTHADLPQTIPASTNTKTDHSTITATATTTYDPYCPSGLPACSPTITSGLNSGFQWIPVYAGCGYAENANNPGNQAEAPLTTTLPGTLAVCSAAVECVNYAYNSPGSYLGVDLQFHFSTLNWACVAYFDENHDPSYWNVPNSDIIQGYGFST